MNDDKTEKTALFRYGLIAPLVPETLPRGELTRRAQRVASRLYDIPHSTRRQVSVDTLLEWTLRYRRNGFPALTPQPRQDRGQTRAVAPETAALIERLKRENPHRGPLWGGRRAAARVGARPSRHAVGLHALPFPARPRPHRTPTAARPSHRAQEVRSRVRSTMPAASFRTPSSIPIRGWTRFSIACARPSPRAAFPRASTWTTPRSTVRRS